MARKSFWENVEKWGHCIGCWTWTGVHSTTGYGVFGPESKYSHRIAYEQIVGPIPDGLHIDHLCRNPRCVNPAHLEPVTQDENMARSSASMQTHCINGHAFDEANTYWRSTNGRTRKRVCRACVAAHQRKRQARLRLLRSPATHLED